MSGASRSIVVLIAATMLGGCGGDDRAPAPAAKSPAAQPAASSPKPARTGPREVEMVAAMEAHYSTTILAHDALLQGDLAEFRSRLAVLASQTLPADSPAAWQPLHAQMQAAARAAAEARDFDTAARTLASVVLACGSCHAALANGPVYPAPAPGDAEGAVQEAMVEHQWATERLWEGVTGPWDTAWERGAAVLAKSRFVDAVDPSVAQAADLAPREAALRAIGEEAQATTTLAERAAVYGKLLASCADCHRAVGLTIVSWE